MYLEYLWTENYKKMNIFWRNEIFQKDSTGK